MAGKKLSGLGKGIDSMGIDALIPASSRRVAGSAKTVETVASEENVSRETLVNINLIEPNKEQPRQYFDEQALQELADSINQIGIIQPIVVQKKDKYYVIIAGERRWRAAKLAGLKEIPVIIKDYTEKEIMEIALIENIQRENLNPIEEAKAYQKLIREFDLKQDEVAERVAKSRVTITNMMRLLKLDERVQDMIIEEKLTTGHARALLSIGKSDLQYKLAIKVYEENLNVRETEKMVKKALQDMENENGEEVEVVSEDTTQLDEVYKSIEENIKDLMGTKVTIKRKANNKGKIEIEYFSFEELERLYSMIRQVKKI